MRLCRTSILFVLAVASGCGGDPICPACFGGVLFDFTVTDAATGQPVSGVSFTEGGQPVDVTCSGAATGASACSIWSLTSPVEGTHTVTVSAPGYASVDVTYTIEPGPAPGECGCGQIDGKSVALTAE